MENTEVFRRLGKQPPTNLTLGKELLRALRATQELLNASDEKNFGGEDKVNDAATEDLKKLVAANNFVTISITFCA
ncbi:hypothetical protein SDJN03_20215, partial [Cucurbita argyrosperma subsp. sororia]